VYFGSRFYGSHYYGPHYWGTAGAVPAGPTPGVFSLLEQGVVVTAPKAYQVGDLIRLGIEVRNLNNALVDATMTLKVTDPQGMSNTYTDATRASTGRFYREATANKPGLWTYFWSAEGSAAGVTFWQFIVEGRA
jgi:hypothetical protein